MSECLSSYAVFGSQPDVLSDSCGSRGLALAVSSLLGHSGQLGVLGLSKFDSSINIGKADKKQVSGFPINN